MEQIPKSISTVLHLQKKKLWKGDIIWKSDNNLWMIKQIHIKTDQELWKYSLISPFFLKKKTKNQNKTKPKQNKRGHFWLSFPSCQILSFWIFLQIALLRYSFTLNYSVSCSRFLFIYLFICLFYLISPYLYYILLGNILINTIFTNTILPRQPQQILSPASNWGNIGNLMCNTYEVQAWSPFFFFFFP